MRATVVQMNAMENKSQNLDQAATLIESACASDKPDMVALPEYFSCLAGDDDMRAAADPFPGGAVYEFARETARRQRILLHAGSTMEAGPTGHCFNTTLVFGPDGEELARYRKIHLFDIDTPGGEVYRESNVIERGEDIVSYTYRNRTIGCTICYDIRFSELYKRLAGADIIMIPAAFTLETGKDHWEVLCRARAIETQSYVLAPAQTGFHVENGERRACYGNSMIVDPWGQVVARVSNGIGYATANLDFNYQSQIREILPVSQHHVLS
jgi:nitrilase